jgi:integrase/recombinase XerD
VHTVRAYRDVLKLLFQFVTGRNGRDVASLTLSDLDANAIACFLDYIETNRSNSAATRNCRRAALRSFFRHLLRNDLPHSLQYTRVLAIPSKKARQQPATYLEATMCVRLSPSPTDALPTVGKTTLCCSFSTTAAPG